jgi:hypothetical protein
MRRLAVFMVCALLCSAAKATEVYAPSGGSVNVSIKTGGAVDATFKTGNHNPSSKLSALLSYGNMTFSKDYAALPVGTVTEDQLDADFSLGSAEATFQAARSASAPATYVDSDGGIQLVTDSNVGRVQGGYYDETGFHEKKGLMEEGSATNLLTYSDGTSYASGQWTNWGVNETCVGAPTYSVVAIPELTSIVGATSQRVQYVGVTGDNNKLFRIQSPSTATGSVSTSNYVTVSVFVRSLTGCTVDQDLQLTIRELDASGSSLASHFSTGFNEENITTEWKLISYTVQMTEATVSKVHFWLGYNAHVDEGDQIDIEIYAPQIEISQHATSFIPTTTTALTRPAEILKYETDGNRNAEEESFVFSFVPSWTSGEEKAQSASITDADSRVMSVGYYGSSLFYPNQTDSLSCLVQAGTYSANEQYVSVFNSSQTSPYAQIYKNAVSVGSDTSDSFIPNDFGPYFYVGSSSSGGSSLSGLNLSVSIYSDAKSITEVSGITSILEE